MAILSFSDPSTEAFFVYGYIAKGVGWQTVGSAVRRKLDMLHYATSLLDLASPPGNRLEALKGDLVGYFSIRVNVRWRIVFTWSVKGPDNVRVIDYH